MSSMYFRQTSNLIVLVKPLLVGSDFHPSPAQYKKKTSVMAEIDLLREDTEQDAYGRF